MLTHCLSNHYCHRLAWCLQSQCKILTKGQLCGTCLTLLIFKSNKKYKYIQQIALIKLQARGGGNIRTQKNVTAGIAPAAAFLKKSCKQFHQGLKVSLKPFCVNGPRCHRTKQHLSFKKSLKSKTRPTNKPIAANSRNIRVIFAIFTSHVFVKCHVECFMSYFA